MPFEKVTLSPYVKTSGLVHSSNVLSCYTDSVNGYTHTYDSYAKQYNATQSRPKPDPLTDTPLQIQYTRRIRPSIVPYQTDRSVSAYCNGTYGTRWYKLGGMNTSYETQTSTYPIPDTDWGQKAISAAANEFHNLGNSLAEYRATGDMFAGWAKGMRSAWQKYRDLKKFKIRNLTPCSIPAAELAYSFGVAPLTEDLFSAVEALRLKLEHPLVLPFQTQSRANARYDVRSTPHELSAHSLADERVMVTDRVKLLIGLQTLTGSTLTAGNPSNWIWELIPFSFVIDWGIPIGQWLEDLDTLKNISFVKGTRTRKVQKVLYYKLRVPRWNHTVRGYFYGSLGKTSYKSHERFIVTSLPSPPIPKWEPSQTFHKVYRAVTLLISVNQPCRKYSGRKRRRSSRN